MIELPIFISILFILTTFATLGLFLWVLKNSSSEKTQRNSFKIIVVLLGWIIIQFVLTKQGLYSDFKDSIPPKIALFGIVPTFLVMAGLFLSPSGRAFIDSLPLKQVTYLNVVRIPVEIVLFLLAFHHTLPAIMSFEGMNYDILAGITAPFIAFYGFTKMKIGRSWILLWNCISLALLITIIVISILAAPSPFQKIIFEGPEFAMFFYPFSWLPTFVVPIVLFGHFVSIRQLLKSGKTKN